jgi:hypothetical protein
MGLMKAQSDLTITRTLTRSEQSWQLLHVFQVGQQRFRVEIKRDAYDFQSWARIERWDGQRWREVHRLPQATMAVLTKEAGRELVCYVEPVLGERGEAAFAVDERELIRVALEVSG